MRSLLLLLALAACKRDDPSGNGAFGALADAHVTITDEGSGPENSAPLEPATAGYKTALFHREDINPPYVSWQRWAGSVDAGRDDVLIHDVNGPGVALYRFTDDGLVLHALDRPLLEDTLPVLLVPDKLRLGMTWESDYGDGSVNQEVVFLHEQMMLPTGPAEVWAIDEMLNENSVAVTRWYAEGVGRIGTSGGEREWDPRWGYDEMVQPLEPQEHVEPALDPVPLTVFTEMAQEYSIHHFSAAVMGSQLIGFVDGQYPTPLYSAPTPHPYHVVLTGELYGSLVEVGDALGVSTRPSAYVEYTARDNAAKILPDLPTLVDLDGGGAVIDSNGDTQVLVETLAGWVVDGVAHTLMYETSGDDTVFYEYPLDFSSPVVPTVADGVSTRGLFLSGNNDVGQVWIGSARVAAGAPLHFGVVAPDGQVFRVTLADGKLSGFVPVGVLPGAVSVLLAGDERIAYSITGDGRVFEMRVDQGSGDITINGLGSVRVEDPVGVNLFNGVIVDPANPGDVYVASTTTSADGMTGVFRAHLDAAPVPVVTAASLNVGAAYMLGGIGVCWRPSDEPFSGAGWTLRGEPVDVAGPLGPDGNCAILSPPRTDRADPNWIGAEQAIEATIPGVGPIRLGFRDDLGVGHNLASTVAVLKDGTVVDAGGLVLGRDGFPLSWTRSFVTTGMRDIGGYGIWVLGPVFDYAIGSGIEAPPCHSTNCYFGASVVGGGAVYVNYTPPNQVQAQVIRPDGTVEDLPAAQTAVRSIGVLLADGRICGPIGYPMHLDCVDRSGVSETALNVDGVAMVNGGFWPLSDGSLLFGGATDGPTWRFDPVAMTVAVLDERSLIAPITAADGLVYAIAAQPDGTGAIVQVTPTEVIDVAATDAVYPVVVPIDGAFLIGPSWTRVPR